MTDKKQNQHEPEAEKVEETRPEAEAMPEAAEQAQVDVEALMKKLEEAEAKVAEHLEGWQRSQAEFINYKNRMARTQDEDRNRMKGDIIKKMLPVLDDLERALANRPADDAWAAGVELVARKFQTILESEGVTRIEAQGKPFDPNFHEAISHEPNEDVESGHVIAVVQNGYLIGDKVIRPALVRVAQ